LLARYWSISSAKYIEYKWRAHNCVRLTNIVLNTFWRYNGMNSIKNWP